MLERVNLLRRSLTSMKGDAMEPLIKQLGKTDSNAAFLDTVGKFVAK